MFVGIVMVGGENRDESVLVDLRNAKKGMCHSRSCPLVHGLHDTLFSTMSRFLQIPLAVLPVERD